MSDLNALPPGFKGPRILPLNLSERTNVIPTREEFAAMTEERNYYKRAYEDEWWARRDATRIAEWLMAEKSWQIDNILWRVP